MAHENFADLAITDLMNKLFIKIKIYRAEHQGINIHHEEYHHVLNNTTFILKHLKHKSAPTSIDIISRRHSMTMPTHDLDDIITLIHLSLSNIPIRHINGT